MCGSIVHELYVKIDHVFVLVVKIASPLQWVPPLDPTETKPRQREEKV
jgi:hypothetical protein